MGRNLNSSNIDKYFVKKRLIARMVADRRRRGYELRCGLTFISRLKMKYALLRFWFEMQNQYNNSYHKQCSPH